jgi:hypothetical protein
MQPLAAGRQLISLAREARRDEPGREGTHRKYCGAEKDAAERISSTRGKYEPGKKETRVGGVRGAPGVKRGLGGTSGPFCAAF